MRSSAHSQDNASHVENVTAATAGRWRTTYEDRATPTSTADPSLINLTECRRESVTRPSDAGGGPADNLSPRTMDATDKHSAWQALPAIHPLPLSTNTPCTCTPTLPLTGLPHSTLPYLSGHLWKLFLTDLEFDTRNDQLAADIGHLLWMRWQAQESLPAAEMTACHQGCVGTQAPSVAHHSIFLYFWHLVILVADFSPHTHTAHRPRCMPGGHSCQPAGSARSCACHPWLH
ncbi:hypothetical protein Pelo_9330 [Pelomyxa schiedti]|nr:hypothetical protein Pelo_9330 [Pelomyxa schiedti]